MDLTERELNGQHFCVRTWGAPDLPKMLLLHGFPEYGGAWADIAPLLAERYHCIAPDQRGYGGSWVPPDVGDYALSHLVSDMAALIGDDGPVIVMGHDWGASVAYGLAMAHPERVSRLIIANGVHPVPFQRAMAAGGAQSAASQYINRLRRPGSEDALSANGFERLLSLFAGPMDTTWLQGPARDAQIAAWQRSGLKGMIDWYRASPLVVADPGTPIEMPALPIDRLHVRCPHLLIWGTGDVALLPEATEGLETFAADLTRVEIDEADHWVLHQRPAKVARIVHDWLG